MKHLMTLALLLTLGVTETTCITLPNGNIVCTDSNGDNTYIYTVNDD